MASKSLLIINKDDFKIFVSYKKKELEKLKKESVNNNDSFIFYDLNDKSFNYLYLN